MLVINIPAPLRESAVCGTEKQITVRGGGGMTSGSEASESRLWPGISRGGVMAEPLSGLRLSC